jgi:hypothetical protein
MFKLPIITCYHCGRYNWANQQSCSRCHLRLPLLIERLTSQPYTDETCTFYRAVRGEELLLLSPRMLECASPHWLIRTRWEHLSAIGSALWLRLCEPAEVMWDGFVPYPYPPDIIPLDIFGCTHISPLAADLQRFAPQLQWDPI